VPFVSCWAEHRTAPGSKATRVTPIIPDSNTANTFRALSIAGRAIVSFRVRHRVSFMIDSTGGKSFFEDTGAGGLDVLVVRQIFAWLQ
jgi:hypothetical protein